jgi:hypothetical protein
MHHSGAASKPQQDIPMKASHRLPVRTLRALAVVLATAALGACGSDEDPTVTAGGAAALTCETKQFAAGSVVAVPTAAELGLFAKTYTVGTNTLVLTNTGDLTINGKSITVASTCLVQEPTGDMLMLSWGTANTVGAGAIVYDSHVDIRDSGVTGIVDGVVL